MTQEFIVSTLDDENDGDFSEGDLSLREAIALANETEGVDTITFDASLSGGAITLVKDQPTGRPTLANTPLLITDSVTITGLGSDNLTIDGDDAGNGIFNIDSSDREIDVTVENITIANGVQQAFAVSDLTKRGGSFFVSENASLLLSNSTITSSRAPGGGAIYNLGTVEIVGSTIENSTSTGVGPTPSPARTDGVVVNLNSLTVSDSNIENNDGTGIFNIGILEVNDTSITNNTSIYAGGAIDNHNTATIVGSNISRNSAPRGSAIRNTDNPANGDGNSLTINDTIIEENTSTSSDNSVIINQQGTTSITNSTIADHSGGSNVGIVVESGTTSIENSTINNNQADQAQSGIIVGLDGTVNISNSTIADNQARSNAGIENFGTVNLNNNTIANNSGGLGGGGLRNFGTATITSNIIADNTGSEIGDISGNGNLTSNGNNLVGNSSSANGFADGDLVDIDSNLGELQDNGGATETIALLEDSPAIDAGSNPDNLATDQRGEGFDRTVGNGTDIGAFEVQDNNNGSGENEVLVVSTLDDENDGDFSEGDLSLREAIALASDIEGADTIIFDPSLSGGTIDFNESLSRDLVIDDSLTINGLGQDNLTLNGGFIFRLPTANANLTIDGLNLVGGKIDSFGTLTFRNSTLSQTIQLDIASENMGLISRGTTNIIGSTIKDNQGFRSVGLVVESGTTTIENSAITGNNGFQFTGAGVVIRSEATVNINNSTIANNVGRRGGGIYNNGTLNVTSSTIANNRGSFFSGGILNDGTATITSSILTNNGGILSGDISGAFISGGNNLISNGDDGEGFVNGVNGDIVGSNGGDDVNLPNDGRPFGLILGELRDNLQNELLIDPRVGELQDNGGATETIALLEDSPAIDAGSNPNNLATDQRGEGFDRTVGNGTDIGAFEVQDVNNDGESEVIVVTTARDENDGGSNGTGLSLREAISLANDTEGANTIQFAHSLNGSVFELSLGQLDITDSLTIKGSGSSSTIIDANHSSRVFNIDDGNDHFNQNVSIEGVTITGGQILDADGGGTGAGILNRENLTISASSIKENDAFEGGGIANYGTLDTSRSEIVENVSSFGGAGVLNEGDLRVSNTSVDENFSSIGDGTGIYNRGLATINNTRVNNNVNSAGSNAGIYNEGELNLTSASVSNNQGADGSAILNTGLANIASSSVDDNSLTAIENQGTLNINRSSLRSNFGLVGGAIINSGQANISQTTISDNIALSSGGAIFNSGEVNISNSSLNNNSTDNANGGAILNSHGTVNLNQSTISGNTAAENGGGIHSQNGLVNINQSTIENNTADSDIGGGGIYATNSTVNLTRSSVSGNSGVFGGGVYSTYSTVNINNSEITNNSAADTGGGIFNNFNSTVNLNDSVVTENSAGNDGSGIYQREIFDSYSGQTYIGTINLSGTIVAENFDNTDLGGGNSFNSGGDNIIGNADGYQNSFDLA